MSNYPDDFRGTNMDATWQPEVDCPDSYKRVMEDQAAFKEILAAITTILHKHRRAWTAHGLHCVMEVVGERLWSDSASEIKELEDNQYDLSPYPYTHENMYAAASERLFNALRVKPINYQDELTKMFAAIAVPQFRGEL